MATNSIKKQVTFNVGFRKIFCISFINVLLILGIIGFPVVSHILLKESVLALSIFTLRAENVVFSENISIGNSVRLSFILVAFNNHFLEGYIEKSNFDVLDEHEQKLGSIELPKFNLVPAGASSTAVNTVLHISDESVFKKVLLLQLGGKDVKLTLQGTLEANMVFVNKIIRSDFSREIHFEGLQSGQFLSQNSGISELSSLKFKEGSLPDYVEAQAYFNKSKIVRVSQVQVDISSAAASSSGGSVIECVVMVDSEPVGLTKNLEVWKLLINKAVDVYFDITFFNSPESEKGLRLLTSNYLSSKETILEIAVTKSSGSYLLGLVSDSLVFKFKVPSVKDHADKLVQMISQQMDFSRGAVYDSDVQYCQKVLPGLTNYDGRCVNLQLWLQNPFFDLDVTFQDLELFFEVYSEQSNTVTSNNRLSDIGSLPAVSYAKATSDLGTQSNVTLVKGTKFHMLDLYACAMYDLPDHLNFLKNLYFEDIDRAAGNNLLSSLADDLNSIIKTRFYATHSAHRRVRIRGNSTLLCSKSGLRLEKVPILLDDVPFVFRVRSLGTGPDTSTLQYFKDILMGSSGLDLLTMPGGQLSKIFSVV